MLVFLSEFSLSKALLLFLCLSIEHQISSSILALLPPDFQIDCRDLASYPNLARWEFGKIN